MSSQAARRPFAMTAPTASLDASKASSVTPVLDGNQFAVRHVYQSHARPRNGARLPAVSVAPGEGGHDSIVWARGALAHLATFRSLGPPERGR